MLSNFKPVLICLCQTAHLTIVQYHGLKKRLTFNQLKIREEFLNADALNPQVVDPITGGVMCGCDN